MINCLIDIGAGAGAVLFLKGRSRSGRNRAAPQLCYNQKNSRRYEQYRILYLTVNEGSFPV